jgi:transcriptional regulator with XRE-family HTH domain
MATPQVNDLPEIRTISADQVFIERVQEIRGILGLSVGKIAERLADLGRDDITIWRLRNILNGKAQPNLDFVPAIATALGVAPLALMTVPEDAPLAVEVSPGVLLSPIRYNAWVCGIRALPGSEESVFAEHPPYTGGRVHRTGAAIDQALALSQRIAARFDDAEAAQELLAAERGELLDAVAGLDTADLPPEQQRAINVLRRGLGIDTTPEVESDPEP